MPADGIVIGRNELEINEKMLTGETVLKHKTPQYQLDCDAVKSGQTLFAGTYVQAGEGRMVFLAVTVGKETYQGQAEEKMKEAKSYRSIIQKKLDAKTTQSPTWACTAASYSSSSCACGWPVLHGASCIEVRAPSFRPARQQRIPRVL